MLLGEKEREYIVFVCPSRVCMREKPMATLYMLIFSSSLPVASISPLGLKTTAWMLDRTSVSGIMYICPHRIPLTSSHTITSPPLKVPHAINVELGGMATRLMIISTSARNEDLELKSMFHTFTKSSSQLTKKSLLGATAI